MGLPAFDTHAYVKKLITLGVPEKQAEGIVDFQAKVLGDLVAEKLATKEDIARLEHSTKHAIKESASALEIKLVETKAELIKWQIGIMITIVISMITMFTKFAH